ncbi:glutathione S-transferase family protein [Rhodobacter sp. KR11]|uniref:glutathione S-transferase family protein n=1 Tax=Rhodobacter sp. KR11 TaxID=2974588 RepID=UPI002222C419|nr:glutathione S-transferase family protein [Rhodobacter sp. KR11]MCW1918229.1 glutathione S-transferase family protein [Rhodobacter sp. KR11]
MQLYYSPTSPFVRKVSVLILETGLTVDRIPAAGTPLDHGSMPVALNPLGKVPALVDGDEVFFDSRVICRYLDHKAGAGLYAPDTWGILRQEALADGILEAALLMVYEGRLRPESLRFAPWVEGQWAKIARALDALEAAPPQGPLTMGQIAIGCALGYLDFRHDARAWRATRPQLAAWAEGFAARPAMRATVPT